MRWIVNENVSASLIRALRDAGHDVLSVKESCAGPLIRISWRRHKSSGE